MERVNSLKTEIKVEIVDTPKKVTFEMGREAIIRSETYEEFIKRMEIY